MQGYYLVYRARAKLSSEVARPNHHLRLLVGHANMIDSLLVELANAEREQISPSNRHFHKPECQRSPVQRSEVEDTDVSIVPDVDLDGENVAVTVHRGLSIRSPPPSSHDGELAEGINDEDYDQLTLTRSPSRPFRPQLDAEEDNSRLPSPIRRALPLGPHRVVTRTVLKRHGTEMQPITQ